jgi:hypothetical protein
MRFLLCCLLLVGGSTALTAARQTKNPPHIHMEDQEHLNELNYFVGSWVLKANVNQSIASEAGEYEQSQKVEWMKGEHFLISRTETKGTLGETSGLAVTGYDSDQKKFLYHSFHSTGSAEHGSGSLDGKTWTWVSEPSRTEIHLQRRITLVEVTPDEYSFKLEIAPDGKNWTTVMNGRATKQH